MAKLVLHRDAVPVSALKLAQKANIPLLAAIKAWRVCWDECRKDPDATPEEIAARVRRAPGMPKAIDWTVWLPFIMEIIKMILSFFGK